MVISLLLITVVVAGILLATKGGNVDQLIKIGLGLAIVKEICDSYNFEINYACNNSIHTIEFTF